MKRFRSSDSSDATPDNSTSDSSPSSAGSSSCFVGDSNNAKDSGYSRIASLSPLDEARSTRGRGPFTHPDPDFRNSSSSFLDPSNSLVENRNDYSSTAANMGSTENHCLSPATSFKPHIQPSQSDNNNVGAHEPKRAREDNIIHQHDDQTNCVAIIKQLKERGTLSGEVSERIKVLNSIRKELLSGKETIDAILAIDLLDQLFKLFKKTSAWTGDNNSSISHMDAVLLSSSSSPSSAAATSGDIQEKIFDCLLLFVIVTLATHKLIENSIYINDYIPDITRAYENFFIQNLALFRSSTASSSQFQFYFMNLFLNISRARSEKLNKKRGFYSKFDEKFFKGACEVLIDIFREGYSHKYLKDACYIVGNLSYETSYANMFTSELKLLDAMKPLLFSPQKHVDLGPNKKDKKGFTIYNKLVGILWNLSEICHSTFRHNMIGLEFNEVLLSIITEHYHIPFDIDCAEGGRRSRSNSFGGGNNKSVSPNNSPRIILNSNSNSSSSNNSISSAVETKLSLKGLNWEQENVEEIVNKCMTAFMNLSSSRSDEETAFFIGHNVADIFKEIAKIERFNNQRGRGGAEGGRDGGLQSNAGSDPYLRLSFRYRVAMITLTTLWGQFELADVSARLSSSHIPAKDFVEACTDTLEFYCDLNKEKKKPFQGALTLQAMIFACKVAMDFPALLDIFIKERRIIPLLVLVLDLFLKDEEIPDVGGGKEDLASVKLAIDTIETYFTRNKQLAIEEIQEVKIVVDQLKNEKNSCLDPSCHAVLSRISNTLAGINIKGRKHIMFSYAHRNKKSLVMKLQDILINEFNCDVWRDETGSEILPSAKHQNKSNILTRSIESASVVVCFLCKEYRDSPDCMKELNWAASVKEPEKRPKLHFLKFDENYDHDNEYFQEIKWHMSGYIFGSLLNDGAKEVREAAKEIMMSACPNPNPNLNMMMLSSRDSSFGREVSFDTLHKGLPTVYSHAIVPPSYAAAVIDDFDSICQKFGHDIIINAGFVNLQDLLEYAGGHLSINDLTGLKGELVKDLNLPPIKAQQLASRLLQIFQHK